MCCFNKLYTHSLKNVFFCAVTIALPQPRGDLRSALSPRALMAAALRHSAVLAEADLFGLLAELLALHQDAVLADEAHGAVAAGTISHAASRAEVSVWAFTRRRMVYRGGMTPHESSTIPIPGARPRHIKIDIIAKIRIVTNIYRGGITPRKSIVKYRGGITP